MIGPIVKAVMASINCEEFERYPQFSDHSWRHNYRSEDGKEFSAHQSIALSGMTLDFHDYSEMGYFMRTRAKGQLSDEVRAYGILAAAEREVRL